MKDSFTKRDLQIELRAIYRQSAFEPTAWLDPADPAYIGIHLIERSVAFLAPQISGDLIDVGCGQQPYRKHFSHVRRKIACDYDATRGEVDFACPASDIPVAEQSFDAILCTEVLEHVPDPLAVWQEFHRILRPGGKVLLTTPMYWPGHEQPHDYFRYTEDGLRHLAIEADFAVIHLIPRGGVWALLGQVVLHTMPRYFPWKWQRKLWNRTMLWLDAWRLNPAVTIGWTILAEKKNI
jgi:SAM-dependent methyltransferase